MRGNRLQLNYAHLPGVAGMAVSPDGGFALTAGSDCAVRAHDVLLPSPGAAAAWWANSARREPGMHDVPATDVHERPISAVALAADCRTFATGCEDGFVRIFSSDVGREKGGFEVGSELVQACARFGGAVRGVDFSGNGAWLAAAGDEPGVVKVVMTAQPSTVTVMRKEGGAAIVAVAFDPKGDFVATVGGDGSASVWSINKGTCVGELEVNERKVVCVEWAPDGSEILVGTDRGAVFVKRDTWVFDRLLEDTAGGGEDDDEEDDMGGEEGMSNGAVTGSSGAAGEGGKSGGGGGLSSVLAVAWSRNGKYALTARKGGSVVVWNAAAMKVVSSWKADNDVQDLAWHPDSNSIMALDCMGQWGIVSDVVPSHMPAPHVPSNSIDQVQLPALPEDVPASRRRGGEKGDQSDGSSDGSDNEDGDGSGSDSDSDRVRPKKLRRRRPVASGSDGNADDGSDRDGGGNGSDGSAERPEINFDASDLEADDEGDFGDARRERELALADAYDTEEERERRRERRRRRRGEKGGRGGLAAPAAIPTAQASFNPSSTIASAGDSAKKHLLRWTLTAAVLSHDETSHNLVEVEFADASRRSIGIKDHFGFSLADVSETGVLLACPKNKDHGSLVSFRPFTSWSNNSDWIQFLASDESALSIALGGRFAAISTDQNVIRLFSLSGLPTDVFGVAGRVVTSAAFQDKLAVVCAASMHTPELRFQLFEVSTSGEVSKELSNGCLVLTPGSKLEWLGFATDTADLVAYDSSGTVWLFTGTTWLPMLRNAGKSADCSWFWLAAVSSEAAIGAQCFGEERSPPATPRPALRKVSLLAPVVDQVTKEGKSTLDERLFRSRLRLARSSKAKADAEEQYDEDDQEFEEAEEAASVSAREVDKCLLALMEVACRKEQNLRAFDIATRLSSSISLKFAVQLASHYKRTALGDRVQEVHRQRVAIEDMEAEKTEAPVAKRDTGRPAPRQQRSAAKEESVSSSDSDESSDDEQASAQNARHQSPVTPVPASRRSGSDNESADGEDHESDEDSDAMDDETTARVGISKPPSKLNNKKISLPQESSVAGKPAAKAPRVAATVSSAKKRSAPISNRFAKRGKK